MYRPGPVVDSSAVNDHGAHSGPGMQNGERGAEFHLVMVVLRDHTETGTKAGEGRGLRARVAAPGPPLTICDCLLSAGTTMKAEDVPEQERKTGSAALRSIWS